MKRKGKYSFVAGRFALPTKRSPVMIPTKKSPTKFNPRGARPVVSGKSIIKSGSSLHESLKQKLSKASHISQRNIILGPRKNSTVHENHKGTGRANSFKFSNSY